MNYEGFISLCLRSVKLTDWRWLKETLIFIDKENELKKSKKRESQLNFKRKHWRQPTREEMPN